MNLFTSMLITIAIFAVTVTSHYSQHGHDHGHDHGHGAAVAVHYTVVTEHKGDNHGHGKESGGGHASVHTWNHDGGHTDASHKGHGGHDDDAHDHHSYPKYEFSYGVKDPKTGDIKSQKESRDGGNVKGSYTLKEADGTTRHVEYSADKHKGFKAVVHTLGHAHHVATKEGHTHGGKSYDHDHGKATSYVVIKKQVEDKH